MQLPERARIFKSYEMRSMHENTAESMLRIEVADMCVWTAGIHMTDLGL